jgi:acyl-CoA synthetase (AMP-forming)/AMP-acid ligase II/aryl carrier-like protein
MKAIATTITDIDYCTSLVEVLRHRAAYSPDETAFIFVADNGESRQTLSYGELDRLARCIAARIQIDCLPGERALLLYPPGLEFITAFFGCLYAGVVAVPAYPPRDNRHGERMRLLADDVQARLLFSTAAQKSAVERRLPASGSAETVEVVATDLLSEGEERWQEHLPAADSLAFIQYTSGSSGTPKGVMVSHGNILHNEKVIQHAYGHSRRSQGVGWLPLFHDMGLIGNFLQPLYVGFPVILFSPVAFIQKPLMWLQLISHYRATTSGGPNFAFDHCVNRITAEQKAGLDLSCWEVAFNGAEPVRAETLDRFAAAFACCGFRKEAFYPCYGMAETTLLITGGRKLTIAKTASLNGNGDICPAATSNSLPEKVSCGFPRFDQQILIVDPEQLTPCLDGQVGEIWTAGPSVARGYWQRPEETETTFRARLASGEGPFLRTGDLGFVSSGELFVTGRRKDLIIIRGRNYYPDDLEQTVGESHPALKSGSGAAFSVEVEGEERLVVVQEVERAALRALNGEEVTKAIRQAVSAQHELNLHAVLLLKPSSIPKTSSGKIQRHACKAGFLSGSLVVVGEWRQTAAAARLRSAAEHDDCQRLTEQPENRPFAEGARGKDGQELHLFIIAFLQAEIARILAVAPGEVLAHQPLNTFGLDSLLVIELTNRVHRETGFKVSLAEIMEGMSLQGLASVVQRHLDENRDNGAAAVPEVAMKHLPAAPGVKAPTEINDPGQLLANLHNLSDFEVDALWQAMAVGG